MKPDHAALSEVLMLELELYRAAATDPAVKAAINAWGSLDVLNPPGRAPIKTHLSASMLEAGAMQYAMCAQRVQSAEKCAQDIYIAMEGAK